MQSKYQEYRMKAEQLNRLLEFLHSGHITVNTVILDGSVYRLIKNDGNSRSITVEPL